MYEYEEKASTTACSSTTPTSSPGRVEENPISSIKSPQSHDSETVRIWQHSDDKCTDQTGDIRSKIQRHCSRICLGKEDSVFPGTGQGKDGIQYPPQDQISPNI
jgi:hypothetical protein